MQQKAKNSVHRLKVVRIVTRFNIGGVAMHVAMLTRGADPERFDTVLLVGSLSPGEGDMSYLLKDLKAKVIRVRELQRSVHPGRDLRAFFKILHILFKEKPDIVDTHTTKAGVIGRIAALVYRLTGGKETRLVHTFHGNIFDGYFDRLHSYISKVIERCLARFTNGIIAISHSQKHELVHRHRIDKEKKIHILPLGLDLNNFLSVNDKKGQLRRHLKVDDNTVLIGIVGRLVPIKNHRLLLDAARLLTAWNAGLDIRIVIAGDGELRDDLLRYAYDLGMVKQILFMGWVEDTPRLYHDLNILALTSTNEGTPVSLIEAMASNVPVITTDAGGARDLLGPLDSLHDGAQPNGCQIRCNGILCKENDPDSFAAGLQFLIDNGVSGNWRRVARARDHVLKHHSRQQLVARTHALYEHIWQKRVSRQI